MIADPDAALALAAAADRAVTIADEAFGLGPVEPIDATLTRIERGIFEQHKRIAELEVLVEQLRCGDLNAFHDGELAPDRAAGFRDHLSRCATCAAELLSMVEIDARARG